MTHFEDAKRVIAEYSAYELAKMADCYPPNPVSRAADLLDTVRVSVLEAVEDGLPEYLEDVAHEIADSCVPIYTTTKWAVFVELEAYQEDVSDYSPSTPDAVANAALYVIFERLAMALLRELADANVEDMEEAE